mgnify:FL=1|jgi:hypothetical protein
MAVPNRLATITTPKPPLTPNQKMGNTLKNINKTAAKNKLVDKFKGMSAAQIKSAYKKMSQADKKKFGMAMFKANQANKKSSQSSQRKASTSKPESTKAPETNYQVTGKTDATMPSNPPGQLKKKLGPKNGAKRTRKLNGKSITEVYSASLKRWRRQYGRGVGK